MSKPDRSKIYVASSVPDETILKQVLSEAGPPPANFDDASESYLEFLFRNSKFSISEADEASLSASEPVLASNTTQDEVHNKHERIEKSNSITLKRLRHDTNHPMSDLEDVDQSRLEAHCQFSQSRVQETESFGQSPLNVTAIHEQTPRNQDEYLEQQGSFLFHQSYPRDPPRTPKLSSAETFDGVWSSPVSYTTRILPEGADQEVSHAVALHSQPWHEDTWDGNMTESSEDRPPKRRRKNPTSHDMDPILWSEYDDFVVGDGSPKYPTLAQVVLTNRAMRPHYYSPPRRRSKSGPLRISSNKDRGQK